MKIKNIIFRIIAIFILCVIVCLNLAQAQSPEDLRNLAQSNDWYSNDLPSMVGQKISGNVAYDKLGAYCIDEHVGTKYTGDWTVDTVLDINNSSVGGNGKVIVHNKSGEYEYNVSDAATNKGVYQALRLGFLARLATERGETGINIYSGGTSGSAKFAMAVMMGTAQVTNDLKSIHVGTSLGAKGIYNGVAGGSGAGVIQTNKDLDAASKAAANQAVTVSTKGTTNTTTTNTAKVNPQETKGNMIFYNGKYYYGPCRATPERMVNKIHYMLKISTTTPWKEATDSDMNIGTRKILYIEDFAAGNFENTINIKEYDPGRWYYGVFENEEAIKKIANSHFERYGCRWYFMSTKSSKTEENPSSVTSNVTGNLKDTTLKPDDITVDIQNKKTYVGPYRITYSDCTPAKIEVTTENKTYSTTKISYDESSEIEVKNIQQNKDFYIVLDGEVEETIKEVKVTASGVKYNMARIVLLKGNNQQNFIVYRGGETEGEISVNLPIPKLVTLNIQKQDQFPNANINLKGLGFKVYCQKRGWVQQEGTKITFKETFDEAKTFYTDDKGYIFVSNKLPIGDYSVYETELSPELNLIYELKEIQVPKKSGGTENKNALLIQVEGKNVYHLLGGQTATITAINNRAFTELEMEKIDLDSNKKLSGIGFKIFSIQKDHVGWVTADQNNIAIEPFLNVDEYDKATEFLTIDGVTQVIKRLRLGTYAIIETNLGEYDKYYDLGTVKIGDKEFKGNLIETITLKANEQGRTTVEFKNPQTKTKISGFVWEESQEEKNTITETNGVYDDIKSITPDKKIEGIEVRLVDSKTGKVRTTYTNKEGEYVFEEVRIREEGDIKEPKDRLYLKNYTIQFNYDGITYEDVISNYNEVEKYEPNSGETIVNPITSKAVEEVGRRDEINNDFKELTGEGQTLESGITLNYNKKSYINENGKTEYSVQLENTAKREEIDSTHVKVDKAGDFSIIAKTHEDLLQEYQGKIQAKDDLLWEIDSINLGLKIREMPNLKAEKDTYKADVSINDMNYTYWYNKKLYSENAVDSTLGAQFDYHLPIYRADISYNNNDDKSKNLQAVVWYKIKLQNISTNLYATVNAIYEGYSEEYDRILDENKVPLIYVSDSNTENNFGSHNILNLKTALLATKNSNYNHGVWEFENPIQLAPSSQNGSGNTKYLYIPLKIKDIKEYYTSVIDDTSASGLENFVEIAKYSVYSDGNFKNLYAGVDENSIPSNLNEKQFDEMKKENDEDKSPGLKLVDAGNRILAGTVFEDGVVISGEGKERQGNGVYESGENVVSNVKVELLDSEGIAKTIGADETKWNSVKNDVKQIKDEDWQDASVSTKEDGTFEIKGFIPADGYEIKFTWGDKSYKIALNGEKEYYSAKDYKGTVYVRGQDRNESKDWIKFENPRFSDAIDDYARRIEIDKNARFDEETPGYDYTYMESTTPSKFQVGIEKYQYESTDEDKILYTYINTETNEKVENEKYEFIVKNIDFGIIERPRQTIEINKDLSELSLTTTQGQPVANAKLVNGELQVLSGESYVTGGKALGYIWVQLDKNITHSMTAKMGYNITVKNTSEIDYDDEDYYKYGIVPNDKDGKIITLGAEDVYDYIKGAGISSDTTTSTWETIMPGNYSITNKVGSEINTIAESYFKGGIEEQADGTIVKRGSWELSSNSQSEIFEEWFEQMATTKTTEVRNIKLADREVLKTLESEIKQLLLPGQYKTVEIKTSKLLSNSDDIRVDNDAEITTVKYDTGKQTGRALVPSYSQTYDRGEWISITPATGDNKDFTPIIIISVSAIAVLGVGIFIIKKKVLK